MTSGAEAVQEAATPPDERLHDALDQAVIGTELHGRKPAWWAVSSALQWVFAAIALIGLVWLILLAILGFAHIDADSPTWIGLRNYERIFSDPDFWQSLKVTFLYALGSVPGSTIIALTVAILLAQKIRGVNFLRTIYFMPSILSSIAISILWLYVLRPQGGLLNIALGWFGIKGPDWLFSFLNGFYLDPHKPTGVNNVYFPNTAMPHVLWEMQGLNRAVFKTESIDGVETQVFEQFEQDRPGTLDQAACPGPTARMTLK